MSEANFETGLHYPLSLQDLPATWLYGYVGQFAELIESGFACGEHNQSGQGVQHLRPMNISSGGRIDLSDARHVPADFNPKRLREGDVLFNNTNSPALVGKTAVVDSFAAGKAFSNHMTRVAFGAAVEPHFAARQLHFLFSAGYFLHRCVKHVNQASISSSELGRTVPLILPPLSEQKRIVAKIEELFSELEAGEESLRAARRQLGVYRQSLLKQAFEGKLTETWRAENPDKLESPAQLLAHIQADRETRFTHRLNQWKSSIATTGSKPMKPRTAEVVPLGPEAVEELPQLPTPWIWTSLSQLADHITDGTHKTPTYVEDGVEFISAKDIGDFHISAGTKCITTEEHEELCRRCKPIAGDILLTKSGTIGRTAVVPSGRDFSVFESVAVVPISRLVSADFFALQIFRTASGAFGATAQKGVAVRHLHLEDIRRLPTALPSLPEQQEIVRLLDEQFEAIERNEREIDAALKRSEALRQAILKKAFTGQLVSQAATDEPPSALLARLRAERGALAPKRSVRSSRSDRSGCSG